MNDGATEREKTRSQDNKPKGNDSMTGYTDAEQAIRATLGLPHATGADEPPAWHDQPGTTAPEATA